MSYATSKSTLVKTYENAKDHTKWSQVHRVDHTDGGVSYVHTWSKDDTTTANQEYRAAAVPELNDQPACQAHYVKVEMLQWDVVATAQALVA